MLEDRPQTLGGVAIKLLGGFVATCDGEPVAGSRWRLRKARELVKLLALAPRHRVHREQLMEALWPELDPAAGANNLHQVVHVARRALGADAVVLSEELLTLSASVDVDEFERAAREARRAGSPGAYRAAMSLYAGELLPENRYDDWAITRREELEQLHDELLDESSELERDERVSALPAQASSFVGREHELRELHSVRAADSAAHARRSRGRGQDAPGAGACAGGRGLVRRRRGARGARTGRRRSARRRCRRSGTRRRRDAWAIARWTE